MQSPHHTFHLIVTALVFVVELLELYEREKMSPFQGKTRFL